MGGDVGVLGTVAQGDDGQDGFVFGDIEEGAEGIGIAHAHDKGVEAHGAGLQDEVGVAEAVVIGAPEVSCSIYGVAPEEAESTSASRMIGSFFMRY